MMYTTSNERMVWRFLLVFIPFICHATAVTPQSMTYQDEECTDNIIHCFRDNVCAYMFVSPQQEGETCPTMKNTIVDIFWTGQVVQLLQAQMSEQQRSLEVLQQQFQKQQHQIDQMNNVNTKQQHKIHQLQMQLDHVKDTPKCCQPKHDYIGMFEPHQNLTTSKASDVTSFEMSGTKYVAMIIRGACEIYQYREEFILIQTIKVDTAVLALDYFQINNDHFLAIAPRISHETNTSLQWLYKWSGSAFQKFQIISQQTTNTYGWAFTQAHTINGNKYFLAMANHRDLTGDTKYDTDSVIYMWNGHSFVHFQDIPTKGAYDATFFTWHGSVYLGFANGASVSHTGRTYGVNSEIYKLNIFGTSFEHYQTLPVLGESRTITTFHHQGNLFLVDVLHRGTSFASGSPVYIWNTTTDIFTLQQVLPSKDPQMACAFMINGDQFLVTANFQDDSSRSADSIVYKFDSKGFQEHQVLDTYGQPGMSCSILETEDGLILLLNSIVYKYI